jgi:hypothetical protein
MPALGRKSRSHHRDRVDLLDGGDPFVHPATTVSKLEFEAVDLLCHVASYRRKADAAAGRLETG